MQTPTPVDIQSEAFLRALVRRQLRLSCLCAAAFLTGLLGLPLANYWLPELMATRLFGFTLTWLILGIGFFPVVWGIAWYFIHHSIALEEAEVRRVEGRQPTPGAAPVPSAVGPFPSPGQSELPRTV